MSKKQELLFTKVKEACQELVMSSPVRPEQKARKRADIKAKKRADLEKQLEESKKDEGEGGEEAA